MRVNYVIVFVSDMKRSVAFYRDVLGLHLKFEATERTEFATEEAKPAEDNYERPGLCRPGLGVLNLDEFHERMVEKNVPCVQEPKEMFGARIAQYREPDGLPISVSEERQPA